MDSHETWAPAVGRGGKRRRCQPPRKIMKDLQLIHPYGVLFRHVRAFLLLFLLMEALFRDVGAFSLLYLPYGRPFSRCGTFCYFVLLIEGLFFYAGYLFWFAPLPYKNSCEYPWAMP